MSWLHIDIDVLLYSQVQGVPVVFYPVYLFRNVYRNVIYVNCYFRYICYCMLEEIEYIVLCIVK